MSHKCHKCRKTVSFPLKECDESGLAFHSNCFRCSVCSVILDERTVNIRGDKCKLYCREHVIFQKGFQPVCKIYGMFRTFRVIF